ncbi:nucleoside 2-deoxyribosyltransferase [Halarcobacter ebronensis]|uniref:Nucleoside 2-deoxyribosyltransferase n=1 Tax=Halarcobacter ebronensis TaxID=1462615 RepID=A0A4Q0YGN6_9BACT|nr:nucleoside 2-deoxyribosyltransferase [Halarcobacter ebronensis]RXJ67931.1 nucleoside 2-deoxyribosyltransferase [Halarcobacter ebronensis]
MKKIYIAGPDVFEKNSIQIGKKYVNLCKKYGFIGLYPLDNRIDFNQDKQKIAQDIFIANKKLIEECDIVIANLNSFRGYECDSGTVWECGYAAGLKKEVYAYLQREGDYIDQFSAEEKVEEAGSFYDLNNKAIEDFNYPLNQMLSCSIKKIIIGDFEKVLAHL